MGGVTGVPYAWVEEKGRRWFWRYDWYLAAYEREQAYVAKCPGATNHVANVRVLGVVCL